MHDAQKQRLLIVIVENWINSFSQEQILISPQRHVLKFCIKQRKQNLFIHRKVLLLIFIYGAKQRKPNFFFREIRFTNFQ